MSTTQETPGNMKPGAFLTYCQEMKESLTEEDIVRARESNPIFMDLSKSSARNVVLTLAEKKEEVDSLPESISGIFLGSTDQIMPPYRKGRAVDAVLFNSQTGKFENFYFYGHKIKNVSSTEQLIDCYCELKGRLDEKLDEHGNPKWPGYAHVSEDGRFTSVARVVALHADSFQKRNPESIESLILSNLTPPTYLDDNSKEDIVVFCGRIAELWSAKEYAWSEKDGKPVKQAIKTYQFVTGGEIACVLKLQEIKFQQYTLRVNVNLHPQELGTPKVTIPGWDVVQPALRKLRKNPKDVLKEVQGTANPKKQMERIMGDAIDGQRAILEPMLIGMGSVVVGRVSESFFSKQNEETILTITIQGMRVTVYPREVELPILESAEGLSGAKLPSGQSVTANLIEYILKRTAIDLSKPEISGKLPQEMLDDVVQFMTTKGFAHLPKADTKPYTLAVLGGEITPELIVEIQEIDKKYDLKIEDIKPKKAESKSQKTDQSSQLEPEHPTAKAMAERVQTTIENKGASEVETEPPEVPTEAESVPTPEPKPESEPEPKVPSAAEVKISELDGKQLTQALKGQTKSATVADKDPTKPKPKAKKTKTTKEPKSTKTAKLKEEAPKTKEEQEDEQLRAEILSLRKSIPALGSKDFWTVVERNPQLMNKFPALSYETVYAIGCEGDSLNGAVSWKDERKKG